MAVPREGAASRLPVLTLVVEALNTVAALAAKTPEVAGEPEPLTDTRAEHAAPLSDIRSGCIPNHLQPLQIQGA